MAGDLTITVGATAWRHPRAGGETHGVYHDLRSADISFRPAITCNRTILCMWSEQGEDRQSEINQTIPWASGFRRFRC
jgi:hypothetical protein